MQNVRGMIFLVGSAIIAVAIVIGITQGHFIGDSIYRQLLDHNPINGIELDISKGDINSQFRHVAFKNDTICSTVASTLKFLSEYSPVATRDNSVYIRMAIFKGRKLDLAILNTASDGWIINIVNSWYKDDSLISVLKKIAKIDQ